MLVAAGALEANQLDGYCADGGALMGHIKRNDRLGIGWSTGSLGHGLSVAMGIATAYRDQRRQSRVTCILGDGEMHEGSIWEALLHLSHDDRLPLTIILDNNQFQALGRTQDIRPLEPVQAKIEAFGLRCVSVDGHDVAVLCDCLSEAASSPHATFVNANTLKGFGVSFTAGVARWHAKRATADELQRMEDELMGARL